MSYPNSQMVYGKSHQAMDGAMELCQVGRSPILRSQSATVSSSAGSPGDDDSTENHQEFWGSLGMNQDATHPNMSECD